MKKRTFYPLLLSLPVILSSVACSENRADPGYPYKAQVLVLDKSATTLEKASFKIETVQFKYLRNLKSLDGDYLNIDRAGQYYVKEVKGSIVEPEKFDSPEEPNLRYEVENGVVVPLDYSTFAMLSAYYQLEQVIDNLEALTGITPAQMTEKASGGKFQIFFEPRIFLDSGTGSQDMRMKLNAAYVPGQKQFLLFQRSPVEKIPLATNYQVVAHEFGHAIFDQAFFKDDYKRDNRFAKEWIFSGINEGFADFMSFAMTGSSNVLQGSIDISQASEPRDFAKTQFTFSNVRSDSLSNVKPKASHATCVDSFYCFGTILVRSLHTALQASGQSIPDFSKMVVSALKETQGTLVGLSSDILPAQIQDDKKTVSDAVRWEYRGQLAGAFLSSFLSNVPVGQRKPLCDAFSSDNNFGEYGFPKSLRSVCP
jgi:hypothetical protein